MVYEEAEAWVLAHQTDSNVDAARALVALIDGERMDERSKMRQQAATEESTEVERLRAALAFYADEAGWHYDDGQKYRAVDGGIRARAALVGVKVE